MKVAFDSSALFKRYSPEAGRDQVQAAFARADAICVAPHLRLEMLASAHRLLRDGLISQALLAELDLRVSDDLAQWEVQAYSREVEEASLRVISAARVRAMDALHVGAALAARAQLFVTADKRQAEAARAVGMATELVEVV